jgi:rhodanese-related sulfurtransferase
MLTCLRGLFLAVLSVCVAVSAQEAKASKETDPDGLAKLLEQPDKFVFLDVREPAEIAKLGSVRGYVNIPLGQLESRLQELAKDKQIVTMCSRNGRAAKAAALLEEKGFNVAATCGLEKIKEQGGEKLVTEKPKEEQH